MNNININNLVIIITTIIINNSNNSISRITVNNSTIF